MVTTKLSISFLYLVKTVKYLVHLNIGLGKVCKKRFSECFLKLNEKKCACNLFVTTVFERTVQVLPERTHPEVHMPGNRGFILHGITVLE